MKKLIVFITVLTALQFVKADTLAKWTFDASPPGGNFAPGVWLTNVTAETGSGTASARHSGFTGYAGVLESGNGSAGSFAATNGWAVGDFYQFAVSTAGYQDVQISFDQAGSLTGPKFFSLEYSTDGNSFTQFGSDYAVKLGNWRTSAVSTTNSYNFDLSSVAAINGQSTVYFRLVDDSTTSIVGGTVTGFEDDRVDNFLISAQVVPEPSITALALAGGAWAALVIKRKRRLS